MALFWNQTCELNISTSWIFFDSGIQYHSFDGRYQVDWEHKTIKLEVSDSHTQQPESFTCHFSEMTQNAITGLVIVLSKSDYIGWEGRSVPGLIVYVTLATVT